MNTTTFRIYITRIKIFLKSLFTRIGSEKALSEAFIGKSNKPSIFLIIIFKIKSSATRDVDDGCWAGFRSRKFFWWLRLQSGSGFGKKRVLRLRGGSGCGSESLVLGVGFGPSLSYQWWVFGTGSPVIHREALMVKVLPESFQLVMNQVVKIVNFDQSKPSWFSNFFYPLWSNRFWLSKVVVLYRRSLAVKRKSPSACVPLKAGNHFVPGIWRDWFTIWFSQWLMVAQNEIFVRLFRKIKHAQQQPPRSK